MLPRHVLHLDACFCALGASVLASLMIYEPSFDFWLLVWIFRGCSDNLTRRVWAAIFEQEAAPIW
jgi:hypothetical protein